MSPWEPLVIAMFAAAAIGVHRLVSSRRSRGGASASADVPESEAASEGERRHRRAEEFLFHPAVILAASMLMVGLGVLLDSAKFILGGAFVAAVTGWDLLRDHSAEDGNRIRSEELEGAEEELAEP